MADLSQLIHNNFDMADEYGLVFFKVQMSCNGWFKVQGILDMINMMGFKI